MLRKSQKGFTLIELLIVIVIIGILSGVLIATINPARQQNRARNGAIKAAITKIAFGMSAAYAAEGSYPDEANFDGEFDNITEVTVTSGDGNTNGTFRVNGTSMPILCQGGVTSGEYGINIASVATPVECAFGVSTEGGLSTTAEYKIIGRAYNDPTDDNSVLMYVFHSTSGLWECDFGLSNGSNFLSGAVDPAPPDCQQIN